MRYEDVEGALGDDPQDAALFRREAYLTDDRPTKAECDREASELRDWPRAAYSDGAL